MSDMDKIAAAFRVGLIPSVAKKTPWAKMTDASRAAYVEGTEIAIHQILAPVVKEALSEKTVHLQAVVIYLVEALKAARKELLWAYDQPEMDHAASLKLLADQITEVINRAESDQ